MAVRSVRELGEEGDQGRGRGGGGGRGWRDKSKAEDHMTSLYFCAAFGHAKFRIKLVDLEDTRHGYMTERIKGDMKLGIVPLLSA